MNDSDKKEFAELFQGCAMILTKEKSISAPELKLYFMLLGEYSIDQIKMGVTKHMQDPDGGKFMPKPACVIKQIDGTAKDKQVEVETMGVMAFQHAVRGISIFGSYNAPNFKDNATAAALRAMGGWVRFCQTNEDEMKWKQKEFVKLYANFSGKPLDQLNFNLVGIADKSDIPPIHPVIKKLNKPKDDDCEGEPA